MAVKTPTVLKADINANIKNNATGTDFITPTELNTILTDIVDSYPTGSGAVSSVAGKTGAVTLVKADVGLGSVDNTADSAKPVSTAQATAINARQAAIQILNEGTNVGTAGAYTSINFIGANIDAAQDGTIATRLNVTVTAAGGETNQGGAIASSASIWSARGTAGLTCVKAGANEYTLNVPAGGDVSSFRLHIPNTEPVGAIFVLNVNYASNTAFNTALTNARPPSSAIFNAEGGTPALKYSARSAPAGSDYSESINTVGGGNIQMSLTVPAAIQAGAILYDFKF